MLGSVQITGGFHGAVPSFPRAFCPSVNESGNVLARHRDARHSRHCTQNRCLKNTLFRGLIDCGVVLRARIRVGRSLKRFKSGEPGLPGCCGDGRKAPLASFCPSSYPKQIPGLSSNHLRLTPLLTFSRPSSRHLPITASERRKKRHSFELQRFGRFFIFFASLFFSSICEMHRLSRALFSSRSP